jgi:hypothetical protein
MAWRNKNPSSDDIPFLERTTRPAIITINKATRPKKERIKNKLQ